MPSLGPEVIDVGRNAKCENRFAEEIIERVKKADAEFAAKHPLPPWPSARQLTDNELKQLHQAYLQGLERVGTLKGKHVSETVLITRLCEVASTINKDEQLVTSVLEIERFAERLSKSSNTQVQEYALMYLRLIKSPTSPGHLSLMRAIAEQMTVRCL